MELMFQQFSMYPTMLISLFQIDMLRAKPRENFDTMECEGKKVAFLEFATFPLHDESFALGLILTDGPNMRVFPAFLRLQTVEEGYLLLQYIEIKDEEYREKFNGDFRSSLGEVLREME